MDYSTLGIPPMVYLNSKRKELGLTQDEFASLFRMKKDSYRKYEEGERNIPDYAFRMMQIIIQYYEKDNSLTNSVSAINFLESFQQEELTKLFNEEYQDVVYMIFDYLTRKSWK